MTWWQWTIVGGVLLGAELLGVDAQFFLMFIGLSALLVGLAELLGIAMPLWVQVAVFAAFSLIFLYTFRRAVYERIRGTSAGYPEPLDGESVKISDDLGPGAEARIAYRGTNWNVRNVGRAAISGGSRAKVVKVDGLTLHVEAE
ncbi:MAG: NfeD family protein [Proteobacteria bacterium]|nr:NfeD family protein [Pseudomonadota bacterium]